MKSKYKIFSLILMIVTLLTNTGTVFANSSPQDHPECSKDPNAPCYAVLFKTNTPNLTTSQIMRPMSAYQGTCGVMVYNNLNQQVASLSSYLYVTWSGGYMTMNSISHSTWVSSGLYNWSGLSDELDNHGSWGWGRSYGVINYSGAAWHSYRVDDYVSSGSPGSFSCSLYTNY